MRERFREDLKKYSVIAKQEAAGELKDEELRSVLGWHMSEAAKRQGTTLPAEEKIYEIQQCKQELMARLKKELASLDTPDKVIERGAEELLVSSYNPGTRTAVCELRNGKTIQVTIGEILTDGEWSLEYYLDPNTVPRDVRKKYLVERTKRHLRKFLDEQIIESALASNEPYQQSYQAVKEAVGLEELDLPAGKITERMIKNIIKKLAEDEDLEIDVVDVDIWEDISRGIDFIIHRKSRYRGVNVEAGDKEGVDYTVKPANLAVQLAGGISTAGFTAKKLANIRKTFRRLEPTDHIDDVIFLRVFIKNLRQKYENWLEEKMPGGPDKLVDNKFKRRVFEALFSGNMKISKQETRTLSIFSAKEEIGQK